VQPRHAPHEHLDEGVARRDPGAMQQAQEQRVALRRHHVAQPVGVERPRLGREVQHLGRRDAGERTGAVALGEQPRQVRVPLPHVREGDAARRLLDAVEGGVAALRVGVEQAVEPPPPVVVQARLDAREDAAIDQRAHTPRQAVEGGEGRQLVAPADQFLDGHVDEVGRVVHRLRGPMHGHDGAVPRVRPVGGDVEVGAHGLMVAIHRARRIVAERRVRGELQDDAQVRGDDDGHVGEARGVAQALEALEHDHQREAMAAGAGRLGDEGHLRRGRRVEGVQVAARRGAPEAGIRRPVDRRHGHGLLGDGRRREPRPSTLWADTARWEWGSGQDIR